MAVARCSVAPCLRAAWALGAALLSACAARPPPHASAGAPVAPAAPTPAPEAAYDWHGLILVPFGTPLKQSPVALHEVWVFHDAAQGAANDDNDKDCYTVDRTAAPRWLGHPTDDYVMCFEHDRLNRIEATVQLPRDDAATTLTAACRVWRETSPPVTPPARSLPAADGCDGRDGATDFSARLSGDAQQPSASLSIRLFSAADP